MINIYAFAISPEDIIRPETLPDKIDRMCREAMQEISAMAEAARESVCPKPKDRPGINPMHQLMTNIDESYLRQLYELQQQHRIKPYVSGGLFSDLFG